MSDSNMGDIPGLWEPIEPAEDTQDLFELFENGGIQKDEDDITIAYIRKYNNMIFTSKAQTDTALYEIGVLEGRLRAKIQELSNKYNAYQNNARKYLSEAEASLKIASIKMNSAKDILEENYNGTPEATVGKTNLDNHRGRIDRIKESVNALKEEVFSRMTAIGQQKRRYQNNLDEVVRIRNKVRTSSAIWYY